MAETLSPDFIKAMHTLNADAPWLTFVRLVADETTLARIVFQFVRSHEETTFGGTTWDPFLFKVGSIKSNEEGQLPSLTLGMSNVGRELSPWLHVGQGFRGREVEIFWVPKAFLLGNNYQAMRFRIADATETDQAVAFRLEWPNFFHLPFPHDIFTRGRCRSDFPSPECGYRLGNIASCNRSPEDCALIGADETANGKLALHPRRGGFFPGIGRARR